MPGDVLVAAHPGGAQRPAGMPGDIRVAAYPGSGGRGAQPGTGWFSAGIRAAISAGLRGLRLTAGAVAAPRPAGTGGSERAGAAVEPLRQAISSARGGDSTFGNLLQSTVGRLPALARRCAEGGRALQALAAGTARVRDALGGGQEAVQRWRRVLQGAAPVLAAARAQVAGLRPEVRSLSPTLGAAGGAVTRLGLMLERTARRGEASLRRLGLRAGWLRRTLEGWFSYNNPAHSVPFGNLDTGLLISRGLAGAQRNLLPRLGVPVQRATAWRRRGATRGHGGAEESGSGEQSRVSGRPIVWLQRGAQATEAPAAENLASLASALDLLLRAVDAFTAAAEKKLQDLCRRVALAAAGATGAVAALLAGTTEGFVATAAGLERLQARLALGWGAMVTAARAGVVALLGYLGVLQARVALLPGHFRQTGEALVQALVAGVRARWGELTVLLEALAQQVGAVLSNAAPAPGQRRSGGNASAFSGTAGGGVTLASVGRQQGGFTQNVSIVVNGGSGDPREIARQVRRELRQVTDDLRFGYAGRGGD